ncbi:hypothetical protein AC579_659 [Pseudocercospora musae]|uniref:Uncharacterized protein n=1 Tax=Pseudocercospora musae TaxID=113226 RepID=A0A139HDM6_9PEZI|nr:hypothetical protein AC579_659 [Pseudocercospora musae]
MSQHLSPLMLHEPVLSSKPALRPSTSVGMENTGLYAMDPSLLGSVLDESL